jgi:hypothetical protein
MVDCKCDDWNEYITIINCWHGLAHSHGFKDFPKEAVFRYCPWCGVKLDG